MLEVTYYVASSLDGFIVDPNGALEWLTPFESTDEDYGYAAFYDSVDAVLLGRATFEFCRSQLVWPYAGKPSWVFSHTPIAELPTDTVSTADSPMVVARSLESQGHQHAYLVGGGELAASFRAEGLITRYIVSVVPVILGAGLPMIASGTGLDVSSEPGGRINLRDEVLGATRR